MDEENINSGEEMAQNNEKVAFNDNKGLELMRKMGYMTGSGLGKNNQGIVTPVHLKTQWGTEGLGSQVDELQQLTDDAWDYSLEDVNVREAVEWLQNQESIEFTYEEMTKWQRENCRLSSLDDQKDFCDSTVLKKILEAKNLLDHMESKRFSLARSDANPFELIASVFFMNRAALKMANIDRATNFMFTNIDHDVNHKNNPGPFYFADVCAGPGGFTEYVLWRKKWLLKGFGFTLKNKHDFKLHQSECSSPVTFQPFYGLVGDGDVCNPDNIKDFKNKVLQETDNKGVHFMMSDGGFSVEGEENMQEVLSKDLYICQCLVALEILRTHGHFVTKVFELFTSFSVGLVYLMYKCFEKVSILKPNSSRPANSERYFICCNLKDTEQVQDIKNYLKKIVCRVWELRQTKSELDVIEIVPLDTIKRDQIFYSYISECNNKLAKRQTVYLEKVKAFYRNPNLKDHRQNQFREESLEYWQIPDKPKTYFTSLDCGWVEKQDLIREPQVVNLEELSSLVTNLDDWYYTPLQNKKNACTFTADKNDHVWKFIPQRKTGTKVKPQRLIRGTAIYGEIVKERARSGDEFSEGDDLNKHSLHIIDALRLGEVKLLELGFQERLDLIASFCKAVNQEFNPRLNRVRSKGFSLLKTIASSSIITKSSYGNLVSPLSQLNCTENELYYEVDSVLLVDGSKDTMYILQLNDCDDLQNLIDFVQQNI